VNDRLRYALAGCSGLIAEDHLEALAKLDVDVVAMADHDAVRGSEIAGEFDARFFTDHRDLLAETSPDVVVVATPHPSHAEIAIDAMDSGAHVLVEKPMAVVVAEADAMLEAAARTNRALGVCFQFRFRPAIEEARRLLAEDALGRLLHVTCRESTQRTAAYYRSSSWRGSWTGEGGGVLINQAPHAIDLLCALAGSPTRISGWTRTLIQQIETEDTALALIEFASGAVGELIVSTADPAPMRLELVGELGRIDIQERALKLTRFEPDLPTHIATSEEFFDPPKLLRQKVDVPRGDGEHLDVHRDFLDSLREGRAPRASGREGLLALEVANAIVLSQARDGVAVDLPVDRAAYTDLLAALRAGDEGAGGARRR
jgi:UDP-N-acetyl-2-amino-2-deoxyglucuronate dehydrogenase